MTTPLTLEKDSPALFLTLKKAVSSDQLAILSAEFSRVSEMSAFFEADIRRRNDAPYNPQPARVASLLINDTGVTNLLAIRAAFWSCVPSQDLSAMLVSEDLQELLSRVYQAPKASGVSKEVAALAYAIHLDRVRHIHMMTAPPEAKEVLLSKAEDVAEVVLGEEQYEALQKKLLHAVNMQRRVLL